MFNDKTSTAPKQRGDCGNLQGARYKVHDVLDQDNPEYNANVAAIWDKAERFDPKTERLFRYLQVRLPLSAALQGWTILSLRYRCMAAASNPACISCGLRLGLDARTSLGMRVLAVLPIRAACMCADFHPRSCVACRSSIFLRAPNRRFLPLLCRSGHDLILQSIFAEGMLATLLLHKERFKSAQ